MIKNFFGGVAVGVANIIPGVSGGTIMVMLGIFDRIMESIACFFKVHISMKERMKHFMFLLQVVVGVGVGLVLFAKALEYLFVNLPNQTLYLFIGLILFSIPSMIKKELNNKKINWLFLIIGILVIGLLAYFKPNTGVLNVPLADLLKINIDFAYIIFLVLIGMISGATMIFPGISGSMVLLVLGYYHLFKGYVANVTTFNMNILIPLFFIAIGVFLGIVISAFITTYLLKKYRTQTMSLIIGLVIMSAIILIPLSGYNLLVTITSIVAFILGGLIILAFEKYTNKNESI